MPRSRLAGFQAIPEAPELDAPEFKENSEKTIGVFDEAAIQDTLTQFETILFSELSRLGTFLVTRKGLFDIEGLISWADQCLSDQIRFHLPGNSRADLQEAGRCLAYELPTAVGFHLFRAMEAIIKAYFPTLDIVPTESQRNWGQYSALLQNAGVDAKVIGALDHIRQEYRNPITHPEVVLTQEEAINLFGLGPSVISMMMHDILTRKGIPVGPVLITVPLP